jgi:putative oxidoreductase
MKGLFDWILSRNTISSTGTLESLGLLVLRVMVGLMMAFGHGWGKLAGFGERASQFPDPLGIGSQLSMGFTVFAEFFCALALVLGLLTRGVAIPLAITMMVAALVIHGDDPWGKKEFAMLYLAPFITIILTGPGKYSLDGLFTRK